MKNQNIPILLNLVAALAGAFGQHFYKKGANLIAQGESWFNIPVMIGILLFCAVMVFFVLGYKMGGHISIVYPFYATTFVWGTAIGVFLNQEPWNKGTLLGLLLVVVGISVMALSLGGTSES